MCFTNLYIRISNEEIAYDLNPSVILMVIFVVLGFFLAILYKEIKEICYLCNFLILKIIKLGQERSSNPPRNRNPLTLMCLHHKYERVITLSATFAAEFFMFLKIVSLRASHMFQRKQKKIELSFAFSLGNSPMKQCGPTISSHY